LDEQIKMTTLNENDSDDYVGITRRSVKWCVQLGLLPTAYSTTVTTTTSQQRIQEMYRHYQNSVDQFPFPDYDEWHRPGQGGADDHDKNNDHDHHLHETAAVAQGGPPATTNSSVDDLLDPLTAMVMEQESRTERLQKLDLKYRKEKALRNRGKHMERHMEEDGGDHHDPRVERAVTLQIIDKDLARLPPPPPPTPTSPAVLSSELTLSKHVFNKRKAILRRVLHCFHCQTHPTPGYRQGMHEIASYLLYALEQEETTTAQQQSDDDDDDDDATATLLGAQVYSMLHAILMSILPAYDVSSQQHPNSSNSISPTNNQPAEQQQNLQQQHQHQHHHQGGGGVHDTHKPLDGVSRRILAQVALHDAVLCRRLQVDLQVPAQLYLTKWIRLLYSREVASSQVLHFWDSLFELLNPSTTTTSLMSVLETVAAARLLLWRGRLHVPPPLPCGQQHDDHDTLHLLMNLPMETTESTREWLQLSRQMIRYNQSRQSLWSTCVKDQPTLPIVTLPPLTVVPGVVAHSPPLATANSPSMTMNNTTTTSTFTTARMSLPATVFGAAASSSSHNNNTSNNPMMDRFSFTSVRQNLEQTVKSTTHSIGQRLHQEWENLAGDLGAAATTTVPGGITSYATGAADAYNVAYRNDDAMTLLDPPVPPARAAATSAPSNKNSLFLLQQQQHAAWARQLQVQTATLQSFLIQIEQEHERHHGSNLNQNHNRVPPIVWEALATLESMRLEMTYSSSNTAPSP
jgi:Rab-GTPase-TBC domain